MIKSMTAFSRAEKTANGLTVAIEIRSYNSRNLDLSVYLPHEYMLLEDKIRGIINSRIARGRVSIRVDIKNEAESAPGFQVNVGRATAYYKALKELKETFHLDGDITLDLLMTGNEIINPQDAEADIDAYWPAVEACLADAVRELDDMRQREGAFLSKDLVMRLTLLTECIDLIESASGNLLAHYQERLKERISLLTRDAVDIDLDRIAQEAAFLADKSDISEEITRIKSHMQQFRDIMDADEPAGRKLNFLLQEFNREFNTIGSKTGDAGVPYRIVDAKAEIEKMREQVQNIE